MFPHNKIVISKWSSGDVGDKGLSIKYVRSQE